MINLTGIKNALGNGGFLVVHSRGVKSIREILEELLREHADMRANEQEILRRFVEQLPPKKPPQGVKLKGRGKSEHSQ